MEAFHGRVDPKAVEAVWPHLGHEDRHVRYAARVALEHQPLAEWAEKALAETDTQRSLGALLALARQGGKDHQEACGGAAGAGAARANVAADRAGS